MIGAICLVAACVGISMAQVDDEANTAGFPLENQITGNRYALRVRLESQVTDDSADLIDLDPIYKAYPSRMYAGEAKLSRNDKLSLTYNYESWQSAQGVNETLMGWTIFTPLTDTQRIMVKYNRFSMTETTDRDYVYVGLGGFIGGKVYSFLTYRYMTEAGPDVNNDHQVSEYLSWSPVKWFRVGTQVAASQSATSNLDPWYARLFTTLFLVEDSTSLRLEYQHYKYVTDLAFDEVKLHLYQQVGANSFIRVGARYYQDSNNLTSVAPDVKAMHYFSERCSAHVGYRYYNQNEGPTLNTYTAGVGYVF